MSDPEISFQHLVRLTDDVGIFEHAEGAVPRRHFGYCLDDAARALVVVARQPEPSPVLTDLGARYLDFVRRAQASDGRFRNRLGLDRRWLDEPSVEDWWGRALWGLGTAAARLPDATAGRQAAEHFGLGARWRCNEAAVTLLASASRLIGRPSEDDRWPWPEPRLTYANAVLPEALLAAGEHLGDDRAMDDGLRLLGWLVATETGHGHLSVTPVGGWCMGEARPGFDQQPIEVAALADGCARAWRLTGDQRWGDAVDAAVRWFLGDNDASTSLCAPGTGGGYDGLHADGCNTNQGAESTLAMISTMQHARQSVRS
jgi:hypothetical protein